MRNIFRWRSGNRLAWWTRRKPGLLHYKRILVRVTYEDESGGLPRFNFLARSDMVCGGGACVPTLGACAGHNAHSSKRHDPFTLSSSCAILELLHRPPTAPASGPRIPPRPEGLILGAHNAPLEESHQCEVPILTHQGNTEQTLTSRPHEAASRSGGLGATRLKSLQFATLDLAEKSK